MHIRSRPAAECTLTASASTKNPPFLKGTKTGSCQGFGFLTPVLTSENGGHFEKGQNRFSPGFGMLTGPISEKGGHFETGAKPVFAKVRADRGF